MPNESSSPSRPRNILVTIFLILSVFSIIWALYPFITNPTDVTEAYRSTGMWAPVVFLVLVAILPTPGAIIGASGASYFGLWYAWLLLYVGNVLAVIITYGIVHRFGRPAVKRFLDPNKLAKADGFIKRHPGLLWVVYAFPIFPLEIITAVVALSGRSLKRFIWIPVIALPVDAFIVVFFGNTLHALLGPAFEYISILVVVAIVYALIHLFYTWKKEEIQQAGRRVEAVAKKSVEGVENATAAVAREVKKIGKSKR